MTEEQIKQAAEVFIEENCIYDKNSIECDYIRAAYIAGVESKDEEIKELKEEIESLQEQYNTCFDGFKKRGTKLGELMKENVKLRNPWISVEDRLPEEDVDNISIPVVAITNKGYWFKGQYDYNNKDWFFSEDPDHLDFEPGEFVTHWMPIPKLKKV